MLSQLTCYNMSVKRLRQELTATELQNNKNNIKE